MTLLHVVCLFLGALILVVLAAMSGLPRDLDPYFTEDGEPISW